MRELLRSVMECVAVVSAVLVVTFQAGCVHRPPARPAARQEPKPTELWYSLPKTAIVVDVQVERASHSPGKYCDFIDLFFPELDLVAACQEGDGPVPGVNLVAGKMKTSIQGYSVTLKGTPDDTRTFRVTFDSSWNVERADSMTFTEGGALTGAEVQRTDRTAEIVVGALSNIAKIAGRFVFGGGSLKPDAAKDVPPPWEHVPQVKANFDLLDATRRAAYQKYWTTNEGKRRLTLATRSFRTLLDDVSTLNSVFTNAAAGTVTVVPELRKQIVDRTAADFLGSKQKELWTPTYEFVPDAPKAGTHTHDYPVLTFAGCGIASESARPVKNPLSLLRCANTRNAKTYTLTFRVSTATGRDPSRVRVPDPAISATAEDVLHYVRPEAVLLSFEGECSADVTLVAPPPSNGSPTVAGQSATTCTFAKTPSLLAQWGTQGSIPKAGRDFAYNVALYEATGALRSLKLTTKAAVDPATLDSAFGIVTTLLDAKDTADAERQKKAEEAAAKVDELNVLTRTRQILDERAKIKKLCEDLGLTTCES